jgi:hypothetical protein
METIFEIVNANWVWAGPTLLLVSLVMLIYVIRDLFWG